jgi:hybrid cluster-associated redox disulfide protein
MTEEKKITLQTNVYELITEYPDSQEVLIEYGIPCASCHFSSFDTIGDSVAEFGIDDEDVSDMLEQLNEILVKTEQEKKETGVSATEGS